MHPLSKTSLLHYLKFPFVFLVCISTPPSTLVNTASKFYFNCSTLFHSGSLMLQSTRCIRKSPSQNSSTDSGVVHPCFTTRANQIKQLLYNNMKNKKKNSNMELAAETHTARVWSRALQKHVECRPAPKGLSLEHQSPETSQLDPAEFTGTT